LKAKALKIAVSQQIGKVSAECTEPLDMRSMLVLAHGAGAGMNHTFMIALSKELASRGMGTMRFNFPFVENGKGRPDFPAVAEKTIEMVILKTHEMFSDIPLFAGGKSFGGRMTSHYVSKNPELIRGLIFYGFPLHAPGKPSVDRAAHLTSIKVPMLFLQGTRDTLAQWSLIEEVCSQLPTAQLVKIDKADHSFKVSGTDTMPVLADESVSFIDRVIK
jgi:predicted alpha/beta-hydrolase family hydrolase